MLQEIEKTRDFAGNGEEKIPVSRDCRLCGGGLKRVFSCRVLEKYNVGYFKCSGCLSLQTEDPYWLDEAYQNNNLANTDTGAVQRNLRNLAACFAVSKILKLKNAIDIGGGDGLLCRMLRDYGINCYVKDKYAIPTYAQGFTEQDFAVPDLVMGFELMEHYPNPASDLDDLFRYKSRALLVSTEIYNGESEEWHYFAPESGQHVFFYSQQAIKRIAEKYDYDYMIVGNYILFVKNMSVFQRVAAKILLKGFFVRLMKSIVVFMPAPGAWEDHLLQVRKSRRA